VLSIKDVRALGAKLSPTEFTKQLGPFVLVQRPAKADTSEDTFTTRVTKAEDRTRGMLSLMFEFEDLSVATLPPLQGADELNVGRLPDSELLIDDASVSKRHAVLTWNAEKKLCTLKDLGSTNGTMINGSTCSEREVPLRDGDILSFGSVQFWYLLTQTLQTKLANASGSGKLGSHSG
jgi:hypothetical protein